MMRTSSTSCPPDAWGVGLVKTAPFSGAAVTVGVVVGDAIAVGFFCNTVGSMVTVGTRTVAMGGGVSVGRGVDVGRGV